MKLREQNSVKYALLQELSDHNIQHIQTIQKMLLQGYRLSNKDRTTFVNSIFSNLDRRECQVTSSPLTEEGVKKAIELREPLSLTAQSRISLRRKILETECNFFQTLKELKLPQSHMDTATLSNTKEVDKCLKAFGELDLQSFTFNYPHMRGRGYLRRVRPELPIPWGCASFFKRATSLVERWVIKVHEISDDDDDADHSVPFVMDDESYSDDSYSSYSESEDFEMEANTKENPILISSSDEEDTPMDDDANKKEVAIEKNNSREEVEEAVRQLSETAEKEDTVKEVIIDKIGEIEEKNVCEENQGEKDKDSPQTEEPISQDAVPMNDGSLRTSEDEPILLDATVENGKLVPHDTLDEKEESIPRDVDFQKDELIPHDAAESELTPETAEIVEKISSEGTNTKQACLATEEDVSKIEAESDELLSEKQDRESTVTIAHGIDVSDSKDADATILDENDLLADTSDELSKQTSDLEEVKCQEDKVSADENHETKTNDLIQNNESHVSYSSSVVNGNGDTLGEDKMEVKENELESHEKPQLASNGVVNKLKVATADVLSVEKDETNGLENDLLDEDMLLNDDNLGAVGMDTLQDESELLAD